MAGIAVQVPVGQLANELQAIERDMQVPATRKLMVQMGQYLQGAAYARFEQAVSPDGTPWAPLAMPRARERDKAKNKLPSGEAQGGQKPLYDSGLLMRSIKGQGRGVVEDIGETKLEVGTKLDYAVYHQEGVRGPIRPKNKKALFWKGLPRPVMSTKGIPARPFIGVNNADADILATIVVNFFENGGR